jgi:hypothetical protein
VSSKSGDGKTAGYERNEMETFVVVGTGSGVAASYFCDCLMNFDDQNR